MLIIKAYARGTPFDQQDEIVLIMLQQPYGAMPVPPLQRARLVAGLAIRHRRFEHSSGPVGPGRRRGEPRTPAGVRLAQLELPFAAVAIDQFRERCLPGVIRRHPMNLEPAAPLINPEDLSDS